MRVGIHSDLEGTVNLSPTGEPSVSDLNEKYSDEVEKLLEMGKEKEYLTFDDINRLLPPELNSADDIEAIFDVIGAEGISISENDEKFLEVAASVDSNGDGKLEGVIEEEIDLDLATSNLDKTNDPVRLYLREMAVVPLLTRDGEVSIARRIERGKLRIHKAIARAPVCIEEMIEIGERLKNGELHIKEIVTFNEQEPITDERIEEYLTATVNDLAELKKDYQRMLKLEEKLQEEPRKSIKLPRMRHKLARARIDVSRRARALDLLAQQEDYFAGLIRECVAQAREARSAIEKARRALEKKKWNEDERELKRYLRDAERRLIEMEEKWHVSALEMDRSLTAIHIGEH